MTMLMGKSCLAWLLRFCLVNYCVHVASLSLPAMPRAATSGRFKLLMVGPCAGRRHRRCLLLEAAP
jgi:hypothetical protein